MTTIPARLRALADELEQPPAAGFDARTAEPVSYANAWDGLPLEDRKFLAARAGFSDTTYQARWDALTGLCQSRIRNEWNGRPFSFAEGNGVTEKTWYTADEIRNCQIARGLGVDHHAVWIADQLNLAYAKGKSHSQPIKSDREKIEAQQFELLNLKGRLRATAQVLIAEIGAAGPQNAEEAASRAVATIADLRSQVQRLTLKCNNSLANNLCPDHRDKQAGKSCLACEVQRLTGEVEQWKVDYEGEFELRGQWQQVAYGSPVCGGCGKPATCVGCYEQIPGYGCDDCCDHGCEGGHCEPVKSITCCFCNHPCESLATFEDEVNSEDGLKAAMEWITLTADKIQKMREDRKYDNTPLEEVYFWRGFAAAKFNVHPCDVTGPQIHKAMKGGFASRTEPSTPVPSAAESGEGQAKPTTLKCGLCGGTGRLWYGQVASSRCYVCDGSGKVLTKQARGLYHKFNVMRTDGSSYRGGKHYGCEYFVLDLTHDPFAASAVRAYAEACRVEYPALAADLDKKTLTQPTPLDLRPKCDNCKGSGSVMASNEPCCTDKVDCRVCGGSGDERPVS